MRRLTYLLLASAAFVLTACSSSPASPSMAGPSPTAVATETPSPNPSGLTNEARSGYLDALYAVAPGLIDDQDRAVRHGMNICQEAASGRTAAELVTYATQEFSAGAARVTPQQAAAVVAAVRRYLCPR